MIDNVTAETVATEIIGGVMELNGIERPVTRDSFSFATSHGDQLVLMDVNTKTSIIADKINIADLLPEVLDIRPFKQVFNKKFQPTEDEPLPVPANVTETAYGNFLLFCEAYGFHIGDIGCFELFEDKESILISVLPGNSVYRGSVEVLV